MVLSLYLSVGILYLSNLGLQLETRPLAYGLPEESRPLIDTDNIFLINADNKLERVPHSQYESEDLLQTLLEEHPELLVGDQINPDDPPRWIVVSREAGIPDSVGASDSWSVDHLLLDQQALPTFVEVKRSSDTRIRREVVGQMLDYAANAQAYWPHDRIRVLAADSRHRMNVLLWTLTH
jgi:hypothetical protein